MASGLFRRNPSPTTQERQVGNIKEFTGDGTEVLAVPGLVNVTSVRVGRTDVPLTRDYKFRHNADVDQKVHITLPFVSLEKDDNGEAILLRSLHSNDGIWQKGEKIFVGGDWGDSEDSKDPDKDSDDSNTASDAPLTNRELRAKAIELGCTVGSGYVSNDVLLGLIAEKQG